MKTRLILLSFLFVQTGSIAQYDVGFIKHLSNLGLKREHKGYLESMSRLSYGDSVYYYTAKFHLQYQEDSLLLINVGLGKKLIEKDTGFINLASVHFLDSRDIWRERWFKEGFSFDRGEASMACYRVYNLGLNPFESNIHTLPMDERMKVSLQNYQQVYWKKPWKGALLSTLIPGLGKVYAGRSTAGYLGFAGTMMFALQAWESNRKLGVKHPLTIINLSVFGLFYGANIYGGALEVKRVKSERRNQFYRHASHYYYTRFNCRLY